MKSQISSSELPEENDQQQVNRRLSFGGANPISKRNDRHSLNNRSSLQR